MKEGERNGELKEGKQERSRQVGRVSAVMKRTKAKKERGWEVLERENYKCIFCAQTTFGWTKGLVSNSEQARRKSWFSSDSYICGPTENFPINTSQETQQCQALCGFASHPRVTARSL